MVDVPPPSFEPRREHPVQDALTRLLGIPSHGRAEIVRDMYTRHRNDAVSYWLQLILATGIATLGLVLSSTGVVIGAMLISPLMSPIVGLGMGLAVGGPLLTLRSMFRVAASILWVVGLAALLTIGLPFHETTSEIAARTSPTVLDLVVAAFCALAAGFTTVRQSDTTSTAAGTAIGISLVPPLCVAGYGLGVGQWAITGGALLLFTANFCAIIFCSALLFVGLGFNHVVLAEDEAATGAGARFARRLQAIFGTRYGVMWRLVLPTLLLASVYVPLRAALGEVAWKIQARDAVTRILREVAPEGRSVRTSLTVEPHAVRIQLALIGSLEEAREIEDRLRVRVAAVAGLEPDIDVTAVADDHALKRIAESVVAPRPTPVPVVQPPIRITDIQRPLADALAERWPAEGGKIHRWQLEFGASGSTTLNIDHVGPAIGAAADALLGGLLSDALGGVVTVRTTSLPTGKWVADEGLTPDFLRHLARGLAAAGAQGVYACVTRPPGPPSDVAVTPLDPAARDESSRTAEALVASLGGERVRLRDGAPWAIELRIDGCPPAPAPPETPAAAGAPVASSAPDTPR